MTTRREAAILLSTLCGVWVTTTSLTDIYHLRQRPIRLMVLGTMFAAMLMFALSQLIGLLAAAALSPLGPHLPGLALSVAMGLVLACVATAGFVRSRRRSREDVS